MIKEIVHDPIFLSLKSSPATALDLPVMQDLLDTLQANKNGCVGMAANMIGVHKCIIAFENEGRYEAMLNPVIVKKSEPFSAKEGCLSLSGVRETKRYKSIKVQYNTPDFKVRLKTYTGFTAQIIQHEIDHCNGILI